MSFAFMSPVVSTDGGPVARSPMERSAEQEGARFELRNGWNVAVEYRGDPQVATQTVAWADVSHLPKLELQGRSEALDQLPLRFGTAVRDEDAWWCRLTPTRALIVGARTSRDLSGLRVTDLTTALAALTLLGPLAREVFARFSAIDLRPKITPVGALRPGSIARQPGILICEAENRYLLLFGSATGEYVWSVVADAGFHLGGRPIGVDALTGLPGPGTAAQHEAARA